MVSSKCGRLLVAAGLPVAAAGLTLVAGGAASAAPVALPVAHVVKITTDVTSEGHTAVQSTPMQTPEHVRPVLLPVIDSIRPIVTTPGATLLDRPEHPIPDRPMPLRPMPLRPMPLRPVPLRPIPLRPMPLRPIPQQGLVGTLANQKHEGAKTEVFHQIVILKIETTGFGIDAPQGA